LGKEGDRDGRNIPNPAGQQGRRLRHSFHH
jgi:hypothetical protein